MDQDRHGRERLVVNEANPRVAEPGKEGACNASAATQHRRLSSLPYSKEEIWPRRARQVYSSNFYWDIIPSDIIFPFSIFMSLPM